MPHHVLVIGVGSIGERHLRCFQSTGRATVSLCEPNETLRKTVADRYQAPAFADLGAALSTHPSLAVVCTPAPLHIPLARQCVAAGMDVLIEKPLSTSLDGIAELGQLAAERQAVLGVAYVYRCFPVFKAFREALASGRFGRPLQFTTVSGQHFPTYRPAYREIYYARHESGGGAIQDALTHILNAGEWLLGPIERLVADAGHQALPDVAVEDTVHLLARHGAGANGVLASYSLNQHQAPNEMTLTAVCERGTVRCELPGHRLSWMTAPGGTWEQEVFNTPERDTPFIAQANAFLDAVENRTEPPCSLAGGLQTLRVNLAALNSVRQGAWQTTWPVSEEPR